MAKTMITEELLALHLEGRTTAEETALVQAAAVRNDEIRFLIDEAEADLVEISSSFDLSASSDFAGDRR